MDKIKWFTNPYGLAEIPQATGIVFSFVTKEGTQCHPWAKCRDFLHDAFRATLQKVPCSIYGFVYDPAGKGFAPVCTEKMRMLASQQAVLKVGGKKEKKLVADFTSKMESALKLLNHYEQMANVELSTLTIGSDKKHNWWYFEGPLFWLKSPPLVSMYTFLIRLGDKKVTFKNEEELLKEYSRIAKEENKGGDNDIGYIKSVGKHLTRVITNCDKILIGGKEFDPDYFDKKVLVGNFHNHGGIVSLCNGRYFNDSKSI